MMGFAESTRHGGWTNEMARGVVTGQALEALLTEAAAGRPIPCARFSHEVPNESGCLGKPTALPDDGAVRAKRTRPRGKRSTRRCDRFARGFPAMAAMHLKRRRERPMHRTMTTHGGQRPEAIHALAPVCALCACDGMSVLEA